MLGDLRGKLTLVLRITAHWNSCSKPSMYPLRDHHRMERCSGDLSGLGMGILAGAKRRIMSRRWMRRQKHADIAKRHPGYVQRYTGGRLRSHPPHSQRGLRSGVNRLDPASGTNGGKQHATLSPPQPASPPISDFQPAHQSSAAGQASSYSCARTPRGSKQGQRGYPAHQRAAGVQNWVWSHLV